MKKRLNVILPLFLLAAFITGCNKDAMLKSDTSPKQEVTEVSGEKARPIEEICTDYFKANPAESNHAEKIISVTNEFMAINKKTKEFGGKQPTRVQPIYAYGVDGVAYYEVWFTEDSRTVKGWILISATDKDYPLVNFSQGIPYSFTLVKDADKNSKVYRFGVSYYALEKDGQKVADYGKIPPYVLNSQVENSYSDAGNSKDGKGADKRSLAELKEGIDYFNVDGYESLKKLFATYYYSEARSSSARKMSERIFPKNGHGEGITKATRDYEYRWVGGYQCYYTQIPPWYRYNNNDCWSGCVNNAWENIYGWWDLNQGKGNLIPTTSTGETTPIYRNNTAREDILDPIQMYCRNNIFFTYCSGTNGATTIPNACRGHLYPNAIGYGWSYQYRWCSSAGCHVELADILTDGIANNYTPVFIGANAHAYVALGWAQWAGNTDWTWAYCYPGWNEDNRDDVWIWWHDFNATERLYIY